MSLYRDSGVVLRTIRLGESDRIVTILTAEHGKVRAVARGVRKTTSRFGSRLEPMSHVAMLCWQGRELDIVNQVEVLDSFRAVREDLARLVKACSMLEVAEQISLERTPSPGLYEMLVGALRVMQQGNPALVVPAFFLKILALDGSAPVLDECAACHGDGELVAFDLAHGGALCASCRRSRPVSADALRVMRLVLSGGLARALEEPPGAVADEVSEIMAEALEWHLERRLRSLRVGLSTAAHIVACVSR